MAEPSRYFFGMFSGHFYGDTEVENVAPAEDTCFGFIECMNEKFWAFFDKIEESNEIQFAKEIIFDPALTQALMLIHLIVVCVLAREAAFKTLTRYI